MARFLAKPACASVDSEVCPRTLVTRIGAFRVKTAVQLALKDAVSRVLTPKKSTDVLREVSEEQSPT